MFKAQFLLFALLAFSFSTWAADKEPRKKEGTIAGIVIEKSDTLMKVKADGEEKATLSRSGMSPMASGTESKVSPGQDT